MRVHRLAATVAVVTGLTVARLPVLGFLGLALLLLHQVAEHLHHRPALVLGVDQRCGLGRALDEREARVHLFDNQVDHVVHRLVGDAVVLLAEVDVLGAVVQRHVRALMRHQVAHLLAVEGHR